MKQILIIEDDPRIAGLERDYPEGPSAATDACKPAASR